MANIWNALHQINQQLVCPYEMSPLLRDHVYPIQNQIYQCLRQDDLHSPILESAIHPIQSENL